MKETETKTQQNPQAKPKKSVGLKILNTVINVMIVLVLIVSIVIAAMALSSKAGGGISTLFGYTIQPIQSDSMKGGSPDGYPSGDFGQGDLMIAKSTGFDLNAEYELGDIVTFRTKDSTTGEYMLISHRIVDIVKNSNGMNTYQTQGDNRETSPVPDQSEPKDYIMASEIGSVYYNASYQGKILKGWGAPLDFLRTQLGFFLVVLLPMIIFFLYELIRVVLNFSNYKKAKADEDKEQAVKEAVAAAKAERGMNDLPESLTDMTPEQLEQFKQFMAQQNAQAPKAEADTASEAPAEEPETALESEKSTED